MLAAAVDSPSPPRQQMASKPGRGVSSGLGGRSPARRILYPIIPKPTVPLEQIRAPVGGLDLGFCTTCASAALTTSRGSVSSGRRILGTTTRSLAALALIWSFVSMWGASSSWFSCPSAATPPWRSPCDTHLGHYPDWLHLGWSIGDDGHQNALANLDSRPRHVGCGQVAEHFGYDSKAIGSAFT